MAKHKTIEKENEDLRKAISNFLESIDKLQKEEKDNEGN